ncbi:tumor necrosis factor ligand superfamily member 12 isoform X1 [Heterocephalus glaber]|uniref:Tumor necrosis factor ligand superfamily member 12 isoform X1 n=1 Tax=Heterocephalus glaber TaxID=10181 RepID=A0AAX6R8A5_HETGA|nr:tumor necrosis factor ligand superfamily member 12 isoform X1 [Heterocephalus glaber]
MAARRSQRRRGRRGEPGTALLAPLVLGLGLALACLGLLLAVVSLGSRASLSAQQDPSQGELEAEDQEPRELNPQTEESQDVVPFQKLVRSRRSAPKGRKIRARRAIAAHYEVHPRPGQDGAQAGMDGTVSGWEEAKINSSNPLRYDRQTAEFRVTRAGLYYLYCQEANFLLSGNPWLGGAGALSLEDLRTFSRCWLGDGGGKLPWKEGPESVGWIPGLGI